MFQLPGNYVRVCFTHATAAKKEDSNDALISPAVNIS